MTIAEMNQPFSKGIKLIIAQKKLKQTHVAEKAGYSSHQIIFLVEHGKGIERLSDVVWWENPRRFKRIKDVSGKWTDVETKAMQGETLYKILCTQERKYGCRFLFCEKEDTGKEIIRILRDGL